MPNIKKIMGLITLSCLLIGSTSVWALPQSGQVGAGQATIQTSSNSITVLQQTSKATINWQSFNVGANETVQFQQPSANSATLNRISGQNPSQIFGSIQANGKIFLLNNAGILFSTTAQVNVASLVATTLSISDENFMADNYNFSANGSGEGQIINQGLITAASGGFVILAGENVQNQGTIVAAQGEVYLAAGHAVTLDFDGDGLIQFQINQEVLQNPNSVQDAVSNSGTIRSDAGRVILTAKAAADVFTNAVNNTGVISASRVQNSGGVIYLLASGNGNRAINYGQLHARGENGTGGTVHVLADKAGLFDQGEIDVSGDQGGGTALIGGDYLGQGSVPNAEFTYVSPDSQILANALGQGNGGKVIVWSNNATRSYGKIEARGGVLGGDGGFIETSGKIYLDVGQAPNAGAPMGKPGVWLLDPYNLTISTSADSNVDSAGPNPQVFSPSQESANLNVTTLTNALKVADVIISTIGPLGMLAPQNGDITFNTPIDINGIGTRTLTVYATGSIFINADITDSNPGDDKLNLIMTAYAASASAIKISGFLFILLNGGTLNLTAASTAGGLDLSYSGQIQAGTVDLSVVASGIGVVKLGGQIITTGGGSITVDKLQLDSRTSLLWTTGGNISLTSTVDSVSGQTNALVIDAGSAGQVTFSAAVGATDALSSLTIRQSGGVTFSDTLTAATVALTDTSGTVDFQGNTTLTSALTTAAQDYAVTFSGTSNSIEGDTTFSNTGTITLGNGSGDSITFAGGLDTTAASTNIAGHVITTDTQMDLGAVTLTAATTLDTGTASSSVMNVGAVTTGGNALTLDSGAEGLADVTVASVAGGGNITVRDSGGTTFTGAVTSAAIVTLTDTKGTIVFGGNTSMATLTTAAQDYSISFNGTSNSVTNDVTFLNTGTITLGNGSGDSITFTGGLDTTAANTSVAGHVITAGTQMDLGAVTLTAAATLDSGTAAASIINVGAVTTGGNALTLDSGANAAADITVASFAGSGNITVRDSGGMVFTGAVTAGTVTLTDTTGTIDFQGNVTIGTALTTANQAYNVIFTGASK